MDTRNTIDEVTHRLDTSTNTLAALDKDLEELLAWHETEATHGAEWKRRCEAAERREAQLREMLAGALSDDTALDLDVDYNSLDAFHTYLQMVEWFMANSKTVLVVCCVASILDRAF
jgi:hypothetical protein